MSKDTFNSSSYLNNVKYIDPFTDFGFKHIFGKVPNKDLLIDFLNGIFKGRKIITDLIYNNIEHKGRRPEFRRTFFDLYCTGNTGEKFIIEMQKAKPAHFKDRSFFYTANLIQEQGISVNADWNYQLPEIYFIAIMDFCFDDSNPDQYLHDIGLMDLNGNQQFYQKLSYIFIEMPKFKKTEVQLETDLDRWLFMLNNLKEINEIPVSLSKKKEFIKLFNIAEVSGLNPQEMNAYEESLKIQRDNYSVRETYMIEGREEGLKEGREQGLQEGLQQGLEQGLEKGRYEEALAIARELKKAGLANDLIVKTTKLSVEEINKL